MVTQISRLGAYGIAIRQDKLLLTTKVSGPYQGLLCLPGGGIEFGETPEQAVKREFAEEVAMAFGSLQLIANLSTTGSFENETTSYVFHHVGLVYRAHDVVELEGKVAQDPFQWYALRELHVDMLAPFTQQLFPKLSDQLR